jgi:hypothetical protein
MRAPAMMKDESTAEMPIVNNPLFWLVNCIDWTLSVKKKPSICNRSNSFVGLVVAITGIHRLHIVMGYEAIDTSPLHKEKDQHSFAIKLLCH